MPDVVRMIGGEGVSEVLLRRELWIAIMGVIVIPLAFLRQLNSLRFTSLLALGTVVYLVCLVVAFFFILEEDAPGVTPFLFQTKIFKVLTIFVFGFTCHQNIFSIYNELIDPTPKRIGAVIGTSICACLGVYFVVALFGYFTFGNTVDDNIMNNCIELLSGPPTLLWLVRIFFVNSHLFFYFLFLS
jgi:amino acid permease